MKKSKLLALMCGIVLGMSGCASKHIVRASSPSVSEPPPDITEPMPQPAAPTPAEPKEEPPPAVPAIAPPMVPAKRPLPPRPRPAPAEAVESVPPKPAPPQISPQLSARDLALAQSSTTSNITKAESNLQLASGKQLSVAQKDLTEKIRGFLGQAHEAIRADDWVRAQNLAEKARVLSNELVKSF